MWFNKLPPEDTYALLLITVLITASITVLINKFGSKLLDIVSHAIIYIFETIYKKIAPYNPFSLSLRSYKKYICRSNLAYMENPVGPSLPIPLEKAFAPLKLVSTVSQKTIELFSYVANHNRMIILGGPGTGKSTIMKSLVMAIIKAECHEKLNKKIPVFITLRDMASKKLSVRDAIVAALSNYHFPGSEKFVDASISSGNMVIVLDGLDEVGKERSVIANKIEEFCLWDAQNVTPNHIIITCREFSYQSEDLSSVISNIVRVEEFSDHHIRIFLRGWPQFNGKTAMNLLGLIQSEPQILNVCRNPLILTILTGLYLIVDDFKLPNTRERFFEEAISELLDKRPARRRQEQIFKFSDKIQILARASLECIEKTESEIDPEKIHKQIILKHARKVIYSEFDVDLLIDELVKTNGILKPTGDNEYTFSHRTIFEYFAAKEASRTMDVHDVVGSFSTKPDMSEVLKFYCGILRNIPQVNKVAILLVEKKEWLLASECLLNMAEIPEKKWIDIIIKNLYNSVELGRFNKALDVRSLEVLSALSLRKDSRFNSAKKYFSNFVDHLVAQQDTIKETVILESLVSKNLRDPERILFTFVHQGADELRKAAVRGLRDIGSEKALDKLMTLLSTSQSPEKEESALMVADLIKTRREEIKERASFIPMEPDRNFRVWPFDKYFPSNIAITVAQSIGNNKTTNKHIELTRKAIEATCRNNLSDRKFLKQWCSVVHSYKLEKVRKKLGTIIVPFANLFTILTISLILLLSLAFSLIIDGYIFIDFSSKPHFKVFNDKIVIEILNNSEKLRDEIQNKYPPNASGLARILPWNWSVEPVLPSDKAEDAFKWLAKINNISIYKKIIFETNNTKNYIVELNKLIDSKTLRVLENSLINLKSIRKKLLDMIF